jgi:hypothetical protein
MSRTAAQLHVNCIVRGKIKNPKYGKMRTSDNTFTLVSSLMLIGTFYIIKTQNTKAMGFLFRVYCTGHCIIIRYKPTKCTFVKLIF